MNWNLFWSLWCLAFAIAIWICAWAFCFRKMGMEKRCHMRVTGRVARWSAVRYPKRLYPPTHILPFRSL